MKNNSYVYTKKKQPIFAFVKAICKLFLRKPTIINYNDEIPTDGLLVGPHMGKWGPYYLTNYYPKKNAMIGAHPMLGSYKERYHYLRDVLYIQKGHKGKVISTIKASFEAIFSKAIYKGMHIIPSYEDFRFISTIDKTAKTLDNGLPVFIFPENSDNGYQLVMKEFHPGYITLAKFLTKRRKIETKIYPYYVHVKRRQIIIGKPFTLESVKDKSTEEILEFTIDKINELNPNLELDKKIDPLYNK